MWVWIIGNENVIAERERNGNEEIYQMVMVRGIKWSGCENYFKEKGIEGKLSRNSVGANFATISFDRKKCYE